MLSRATDTMRQCVHPRTRDRLPDFHTEYFSHVIGTDADVTRVNSKAGRLQSL